MKFKKFRGNNLRTIADLKLFYIKYSPVKQTISEDLYCCENIIEIAFSISGKEMM